MNRMRTILVVDDDEITNYLNLHIISSLEIANRIEIRQNGKEALEYLLECNKYSLPWPDLILLDIIMPCMDGKQFLEEFEILLGREMNMHTEIVLISALDHPSNLRLCYQFPIKSFILKPLTRRSLCLALDINPFYLNLKETVLASINKKEGVKGGKQALINAAKNVYKEEKF